jgi:hypothetical protein
VSQSYSKVSYREPVRQENNGGRGRGENEWRREHEKWGGRVSRRENLCEAPKIGLGAVCPGMQQCVGCVQVHKPRRDKIHQYVQYVEWNEGELR